MINQGKYRKQGGKQKWTENEYHYQEDDDSTQKDVNIFCDTTQFP